MITTLLVGYLHYHVQQGQPDLIFFIFFFLIANVNLENHFFLYVQTLLAQGCLLVRILRRHFFFVRVNTDK